MVFLTDMDSVVPQKRPRERDSGCDAENEPEPEQQAGEEKEHQRKRARLSCNICKARKTKASMFLECRSLSSVAFG